MSDSHNRSANDGAKPKLSRNVIIAIALAVLALIVLALLMRGQGGDANNMNGADTPATAAAGMNTGGASAAPGAGGAPGYGEPNPAPTTGPTDETTIPAVPETGPAATAPAQGTQG